MKESKVRKGESISAWMTRAPASQQKILRKLRTLILKTLPDIEESVKWSHPFYGYGKEGLFALVRHADHVNLQLWVGAYLRNDDGVVEGTGKSIRHVKLDAETTIPDRALKSLIRQSAEYIRSK